jgi:hypothetical protein
MNIPQQFDDLTDEELCGAERVAKQRRDQALKEWQREQAKIREIARVRAERGQK